MPATDEFLAWADRAPRRPALATGARTLEYAALAERAQAVAVVLTRRLGGAPAQRVALHLGNDASFVTAFLGIVLAGMTAVVLDPKASPAERDAALAGAGARLLITTERAANAALTIPTLTVADPLAQQFPLSAAGKPRVSDEDEFPITFTSGTTGTPKGVLRTHRSWIESLASARAEFPLQPRDRVLIAAPLAHSIGLFALVETLSSGAATYVLPSWDPTRALSLMAQYAVSRVVGVPTIMGALLAAAGTHAAIPSARELISAGSKLPAEYYDRFARLCPRATIIEYYGASELSFVSVAHRSEGCPARSVGRPMTGATVEIRRADGSLCAPKEVGRVWVRSAMHAQGYVCGADAYGLKIGQDGFASVGDTGWREDGWLCLCRRDGGMLITGGHNVFPAEVEDVLCRHERIADAVVLGIPDPRWGDCVVAVIAAHPPGPPSASELLAHCRAHIAAYKCPKRIFLAATMPLTPSGKIARAALSRMVGAEPPELPELAA